MEKSKYWNRKKGKKRKIKQDNAKKDYYSQAQKKTIVRNKENYNVYFVQIQWDINKGLAFAEYVVEYYELHRKRPLKVYS